MTSADTLVERGADRLRDLSERAAEHGGVTEKLAQPLADDAEFLRKLKPSLIKARVKGEAPTGEQPRPVPPPTVRKKPQTQRRARPSVSPFVVVGAALAAGILLAKWIDWRAHAHPRG